MMGQRGNGRRGDRGKVAPFGGNQLQYSFANEVPRLLEQPTALGGAGTAAFERALELLRAAAPYLEADSRKHRIAARLSGSRVRRLPGLLRPVVVLGMLMGGFGAVASAAIWHWPQWVADAYERLTPETAPAPAPAPSAREHRMHRARRSTDVASVPPAAPAVAPLAVAEPMDTREPALTPAHRALTNRVRARRSAGEDTSAVLAAMRALRRDHNPVRARALLAMYLEQHPTGALAEEALAMSIEAAVAHRDADAAALAQRYLRVYPSGPFRSLAAQALAGSH